MSPPRNPALPAFATPRRALFGGLAALPFLPRAARAAGWSPSKPVTLLVPFAVGGTTDVMARLIAQPMAKHFGQPVVVENVTGAGGNIGAGRAARAAPDGHTVFLAHVGVFSINQHLYRNIPFETARDFVPVGLVATNPMLLVVSTASGIDSLDKLKARARQGDLRIATSGTGTTLHIAALQFLSAVGGRADLIPYRGGGPATNDLMAGNVDMLVDQALTSIPTAQSGKAKALCVTGPARLAALPDVPTTAELGLAGFDIEIWNGLVLPARTPPAIVAAHEAALAAALDDANVRARFAESAARAPEGEERSARHLGQLIARDAERWGRLLREAGVEREG
ncbi:tripartite tricarboxylate transporter substrate binding protein [Roseomonas sp. NAR14]|uniref:Tripartite tricarboxylate transporter substrate binding protein n=1 Tax=Roseomonas acroporae TaxID=2937791 RepID=A0A9X1Y746_9PROT|nr:tripartite tricarboxylate transporter substrate binding protein [Roseomonas acroporae]MCK8784342.1 tripartite tricarboxylate transporter substrate binding protein [Roseomonas acroporae]